MRKHVYDPGRSTEHLTNVPCPLPSMGAAALPGVTVTSGSGAAVGGARPVVCVFLCKWWCVVWVRGKKENATQTN